MLGEHWRHLAQLIRRIYEIPGNLLPEPKRMLRFNGYFVRQRSVAMGMICSSCFAPADMVFDWTSCRIR